MTFIHHDGFREIAPEDSPTELAHLADLADKGFKPQSLAATAAREGAHTQPQAASEPRRRPRGFTAGLSFLLQ